MMIIHTSIIHDEYMDILYGTSILKLKKFLHEYTIFNIDIH